MRTRCDESLLEWLSVKGERYQFVSLARVPGIGSLDQIPYSLRHLLENVARCSPDALLPVAARAARRGDACEVPFYPNRLMLHDTTCLPALVDLAGLRDIVAEMGGDPAAVNPVIPSVLTVDHSIIVERHGSPSAADENLAIDFRRNAERYRVIRWAERSLDGLRVIPPNTGIIHQMNMEVVGEVVREAAGDGGARLLHLDDLVATDSHTPMINAIGILGWGVGGLEGQAAMMGEPVSILFPEVVGVRLTGRLPSGVTGTDLALHLVDRLRRHGVVGRFVEFCGPGLDALAWGDRGTVANMAPEYGATVAFFPFDGVTLDYLGLTGRPAALRERVAAYMAAQGLWRRPESPEPRFDSVVELDLSTVERAMAGPRQPQQHRRLSEVAPSFRREVLADLDGSGAASRGFVCPRSGEPVHHGAVVIAAITSCTNTANPAVMVQAGLLARRARQLGLRPKPWVKTSLSPGSRVVADYLERSGLMADLASLGFDVAGFGCMTCIGNSGPLEPGMEGLCRDGLRAVAVLSGNRNFDGRVNAFVKAAYLASPALVVASAIAGTIDIDLERDPLGTDASGGDVRLDDLMPSDDEVKEVVRAFVAPDLFEHRAETIWTGPPAWRDLSADTCTQFRWDERSTYVRRPAYLRAVAPVAPLELALDGARVLMVLGDNVTTDHISPAGSIPPDSAAGRYLIGMGESPDDLNQYSTRRSNHEVMLRGAFTNRAAVNLLPGVGPQDGGALALTADRGAVRPVYEAAATYADSGIPLVIVAGRHYGAGSSRDWAAKVQALLGIRAVIAESFERIHRSNLIGMGVLPMEFLPTDAPGERIFSAADELRFEGLGALEVGLNRIVLRVSDRVIPLGLRVDSRQELLYVRHGGVLPYVARKVLAATRSVS